MFENDVKIYGIQTASGQQGNLYTFENDVKIYGIQTPCQLINFFRRFENDVKIYGIQNDTHGGRCRVCLRMM